MLHHPNHMESRLANDLVKPPPCLESPLTLLMLLLGLIMIMLMLMMMMTTTMTMMIMMMMLKVGGFGNSAVRSSNDGKSSQLLCHSISLHGQ